MGDVMEGLSRSSSTDARRWWGSALLLAALAACGPRVGSGSGSASGDGTADAGTEDAASATTSDGSACGDGIVVPGVLCWIEVPLARPEELSFDIVRAFDDGRVLFADKNRANVAILDYAARGPTVGPVVSAATAEFHHTIHWALPLQLDADPAVEVITADLFGFVLYEARGDVLEVGAKSFPPIGSGGYMIVAIDIDGDGVDELVRATGGLFAVSRLGTDGTWQPLSDPLPQPPCHALNLAVADFDGDGRDDLVVLGNHSYGTQPSIGEELCPNYDEGFDDMYILLNRYPEQGMEAPFELVLGPEVPFETVALLPTPPTLAPGDYDGDGVIDLFVRSSVVTQSHPWFMRGLGNGRLSEPLELEFNIGTHSVGDLDGDGSMEVIARLNEDLPKRLWIWWGNGESPDGQPVDLESTPEGNGVKVRGTADMNGDGVSDVLIQSSRYHLLLSNP